MLLSEKKVWDVVNGKIPRPKAVEDYPAEEQAMLKDTDKRRILKEMGEWEEKTRRPFESSASRWPIVTRSHTLWGHSTMRLG